MYLTIGENNKIQAFGFRWLTRSLLIDLVAFEKKTFIFATIAATVSVLVSCSISAVNFVMCVL